MPHPRVLALALAIGLGCLCAGVPARAYQGKPPAAPAAPKLDPKLEKLEARLKKSPKDEKLKKEAAETYYQVGHTMMNDPALPPRVKYRGALKHFNRALQLAPKHAKAAEEKKLIEDIYTQMGMPIPK